MHYYRNQHNHFAVTGISQVQGGTWFLESIPDFQTKMNACNMVMIYILRQTKTTQKIYPLAPHMPI